MAIWQKTITLEQLNAHAENTLVRHLGMVFTALGEDYLTARMPVNTTTHQHMGILHGGASCALAETVGSTAANLCVDLSKHRCVGMSIHANHIRSVVSGHVYATARPVHRGKRTQVWEIEIQDDEARRVCLSQLTMAVVDY